MIRSILITSALVVLSAPVIAQDAAISIENIAIFTAGPCLIPQSGDVLETLKVASKGTMATGLPLLMEQDKSAVFGDWAGLNVTLSAGIDNVSCSVRMPGTLIDHAGFELIEAHLSAAIEAQYSDFIESISDDPSPHVDSHDWVIRTEANDAIAVTLQFGTESGIIFVSNAQQKYD